MTPLLDALTTNPTIGAVVVAVLGACLGLWLAAAWWAYSDLSRRVQPELVRLAAPAWILLSTPVLLPLALATYLLVRPQTTVAERRSLEILAALVGPAPEDAACPQCGRGLEDGWRRCPTCAAWLGAPCSRCERWSPVDLEICPYCATEWSAEPETAPEVAALVPVPVAPAIDRPILVPRRARNRETRDDRRAGRAASASGPRLARVGR